MLCESHLISKSCWSGRAAAAWRWQGLGLRDGNEEDHLRIQGFAQGWMSRGVAARGCSGHRFGAHLAYACRGWAFAACPQCRHRHCARRHAAPAGSSLRASQPSCRSGTDAVVVRGIGGEGSGGGQIYQVIEHGHAGPTSVGSSARVTASAPSGCARSTTRVLRLLHRRRRACWSDCLGAFVSVLQNARRVGDADGWNSSRVAVGGGDGAFARAEVSMWSA